MPVTEILMPKQKNTTTEQSTIHSNPTDYNKAPKHFLSAKFVDSEFGYICAEQEFRCIRCCSEKTVVVPQDCIDNVDSKELAGDTWVRHILTLSGWVTGLVKIENEKELYYTLCPVCVATDIGNYRRFALCFRSDEE